MKYDKALKRITDNKSQTKQSRDLRWKSVENVFVVEEKTQIEGKHILLVDDVITTGATAESCIKKLCESGANKISIATIALAK